MQSRFFPKICYSICYNGLFGVVVSILEIATFCYAFCYNKTASILNIALSEQDSISWFVIAFAMPFVITTLYNKYIEYMTI